MDGIEQRRQDAQGKAMRREVGNLFRDMGDILPYMDDERVTDIFVLASGELIVNRFGTGREWTGKIIGAETVLRIIYAAANLLEKKFDNTKALITLEGVLPRYNARITGIFGECVKRPCLTLRMPSVKAYSLESYVEQKRLSEENYEKLVALIKARKNILISGSTGSGKTTFFNAVIEKMREFTPDDNFYIVEDVEELVCKGRMMTHVVVPPTQAADAVRLAMRWTPDRILFGEVRYGEVANELLKSWNTGHTGNCTTIHADTAASSIGRIERLLSEVIPGKLPDVTEAVQVCVHLSRKPGFGPVVDEVLETNGTK